MAIAWIGAHKVPDRTEQERDRAKQRFLLAVIGVSVSLLVPQIFGTEPLAFTDPVVVLLSLYGLSGLLFYRYLILNPMGGVGLQYLFMAGDMLAIVGAVAYRPESMGWLSLLLISVIARTSIRYGVRSLFFVWSVAFVSSVVAWSFIAWRGDLYKHTQVFLFVFGSLVIAAPMFVQAIKGISISSNQRANSLRQEGLRAQISRRMEFLSMISHELRTPLQSILSSIELLEMSIGPETNAREIERLGLNANFIGGQLNDIITLARGELGVFAFQPGTTSVQDSMIEAIEAVKPFAVMKGLELSFNCPDSDLSICIDKVRLVQIASNLLLNSIKYTQKGSVTLELHNFDTGSESFSFSVIDTGSLSSRVSAEEIFTTYDRLGEGVYPSSSAGIGLAVVKLLSDFLDGQVKVGRTGNGLSCLTVSLPAAVVEVPSKSGGILIVGKELADECVELGVADLNGLEIATVGTMGHAMMRLASRHYDLLVYDARYIGEPEPLLLRSLERAKAEGNVDVVKVVVTSVGMWQSKDSCVVKVIEEPLSLRKLKREFAAEAS